MKYLIAAAVLLLCAFPLQAYGRELTISVDLSATIHRMASGVGASWHAMEDSLPFDGRITHGGSAWGANPDPDDEEGWQQVYRHAGWLGLDFCRVELERRIFEPERRQFTWDSREMRILYRILDWCQQRGADVFLQQMWCNVDWLAYPEFRGDPVKRVHSAPADLDDFAYGLGALAEHLVRDKGYTCIKWLCLSNEPGWDWSWWQMPPNNPAPFAPALQKVRAELDRRGLRELPLSGPDWTDTRPSSRRRSTSTLTSAPMTSIPTTRATTGRAWRGCRWTCRCRWSSSAWPTGRPGPTSAASRSSSPRSAAWRSAGGPPIPAPTPWMRR